MQRMMIWGGLTCLSACLVKPTLVTIAPDFGYVDGCIDVTIQGNHLGTNATGDVGGVALTNIKAAETEGTCGYEGKDTTLNPGCENIQFGSKAECEAVGPDCKWDVLPDYAQDIGFLYTATVGKAPGGKSGFYDVNLSVDGDKLTLPLGFFYRDCPASFIVDHVYYPLTPSGTTSTTAVSANDQINLVGCNLDPANVSVEYHLATFPPATSSRVAAATDTAGSDTAGGTTGVTTTTIATASSATGELVDDCSTAQAHTLVPAGLAPGVYEVWLKHKDGTIYSAETCTARGGHPVDQYTVTTSTYGYTFPITWIGDGPTACVPIFVTVGGR